MKRPRPLVTAHSGCMGSAPNGRRHLELALSARADVIELDLRLSADRRIVLAHDDAIAGPTGLGLPISTTGHAELLEAARAAGGELLTLEEALDFLAGRRTMINLDAKEAEAALVAGPVLRRRGLLDQVLFSGLGEAEARELRASLPEVRCLLNADALLPASGYGEEELRLACAALTESGCCGLNLDWRAARPGLMDYARLRCIPVLLWTIDSEADLRLALDLGPWSITTHRPDLLVSMLDGEGSQERQP